MFDTLYQALRKLKNTSSEGFEGFVKALLDGIAPDLGITFLSKSGWQGGVDASSAGVGNSWVGLECKHYEAGSCPSARELVGGLEAAISKSREQLDAWLLATTGAVAEQAVNELTLSGNRAATAVVVIDWQQAGLPMLAVLCAVDRDLTLQELKNRLPGPDFSGIESNLASVGGHPGFGTTKESLLDQLRAADLGFGRAKDVANVWIRSRLASRQNAWSALNQHLCPLDSGYAELVERTGVRGALDGWHAGWAGNPSLAMVHGREGAGKSWAALDWWSRLPDPPLTLLITSNMPFPSSDPRDVLEDALRRQLGVHDAEIWRRRLNRWLTRPAGPAPMILLIIDGLNERFREDWGSRLPSFDADPFAGRVAVLASCWTTFWQERVEGQLPYRDQFPVTEVPVAPYDDGELRQALATAGVLSLERIKERTRDILRVPRVCHVAITRFRDLLETDDLTVERMMVTDWEHRRRTKAGLAHNDREVNQLVIALARDLRKGTTAFEGDRLRQHSSLARRDPHRDLQRDFEEIIAGDLFEPGDPETGTWRIRAEHTGLALGMLLAEEVRRSAGTGLDAAEAAIAQWEPFADFSQGSGLLRGAVATACLWQGYPPEGLWALLRAWLRLRNRPEEHHDDFRAWLPDQPNAWFEVAEQVWPHPERYPDGREWLAEAVLHHIKQSDVSGIARTWANRWLKLWHRDGCASLLREDGAYLVKHRRGVDERQSAANPAEKRLIDHCTVLANEPEQPEIAAFALLIVSYADAPRADFADGLAAWALLRSLSGWADESEMVAWCLRFNRVDSGKAEAAVLAWAERLLDGTAELGRSAARRLLQALGTTAAAARLDELGGEESRGEAGSRDFFPQAFDPAALSPDMTAALERLAGLDPATLHVSRNFSAPDHAFRDLEKGLAAYTPGEGAAFVRRVLGTAPQREYLALRQLSLFAVEHGLLIGPDEAAALETGRQGLLPFPADGRDHKFAEVELTLALLPSMTAAEQLRYLVERPIDAILLNSFEDVFAGLSATEGNGRLAGAVSRDDLAGLRATLWFLCGQSLALADADREALVRCFGHGDAIVRQLAFRLAARTKDDRVLDLHRSGEWRSDGSDRSTESFHGTVALGSGTAPIRYEALRERAAPELFGWLAERDGREEAFRAFAEDLDAIWTLLAYQDVADRSRNESVDVIAERPADGLLRAELHSAPDRMKTRQRAVSALTPNVARDLETFFRQVNDPDAWDREQAEANTQLQQLLDRARSAGISLFGRMIRPNGLRQVVGLRPDLVDRWLGVLDTDQAESIIWRAGEFYRALAFALAESDPARAVMVLRRLHSTPTASRTVFRPLEIDALTYAAFDMPAAGPVDDFRHHLLDEAVTDEALFVLALVAQRTGNTPWLVRAIDDDVASGELARQARALTLVGWLDHGAELDRLRPLLDGRSGFLAEVAETATARLTRNARARHWFGEFLLRRDPDRAWGALRLTLRCIDRRFHLWRRPMSDAVADVPERWRHTLAQNRDAIDNAIRRNEDKLDAVLFGTKIAKGQLAPWYP